MSQEAYRIQETDSTITLDFSFLSFTRNSSYTLWLMLPLPNPLGSLTGSHSRGKGSSSVFEFMIYSGHHGYDGRESREFSQNWHHQKQVAVWSTYWNVYDCFKRTALKTISIKTFRVIYGNCHILSIILYLLHKNKLYYAFEVTNYKAQWSIRHDRQVVYFLDWMVIFLFIKTYILTLMNIKTKVLGGKVDLY